MQRRLLLLASVVLVLACGKKKTEEDRVRDVLDAAEKGAEAPKLRDVMDHVSDRFHDDSGADKDTIKGVLAGQMLRGPVGVVRRNETITVEGATAKASFDALLTQKQPGATVPSDLGAYHFDLELEKEPDGEWRVTAAKYREVPPSQLLTK